MSIPSSDISLLSKIASLTETLAKDPRSAAFVQLSEAYRQMGLLDDALEVAEKGVQQLPRCIPGHMILGRILFEKGEIAAAATAFETAHAIDETSVAAIKGLARALSRLGNNARARQLLEEGARLDPNDPGVRKMLAALSPPATHPPQTPSSSTAKAKEPIATSTIAEIYLQQGFPERALKVYLDLLAVHPDNADLKRKVAEISERVSQKAEAASEIADPPHAKTACDQRRQPAEPATAEESGKNRQVEELNRWLTAIRIRREHVLQ